MTRGQQAGESPADSTSVSIVMLWGSHSNQRDLTAGGIAVCEDPAHSFATVRDPISQGLIEERICLAKERIRRSPPDALECRQPTLHCRDQDRNSLLSIKPFLRPHLCATK